MIFRKEFIEMSKKSIKITVNDATANYLRSSLLGASGCVEELVQDALHNANMGVERTTKKELTNITKKLDTEIQKIELKYPEVDISGLKGVYSRYDKIIEHLWER